MGRAFPDRHNDCGIAKCHVAGIAAGEDGASHQYNEDIALMHTIPGMVAMCPADDVEAKAAVKYEGPVLCKSNLVPVYKIGMQDVFGESGSAVALIEKYKLDAKGGYEQVKELI